MLFRSENEIGPKFLRITDIQNKFINWEDVPYCEIDKGNYKKYKLFRHDILISRTGASTGTNTIIYDYPPNAVFASYLIRLIIEENYNPLFVHYFLQSRYYKNYISSILGGSAQPNANAQELTNVSFPLLGKEYQDKVSDILYSFDKSIQINNIISKLLQQIAQLLFKHWFIDFEFSNEQGKPYKSSGGEFTDSELGKIPKGWTIKKLGSVFNISWGDTSTTKKSYIKKGYKAYSASGLDGYLDHYDYDCTGIIISAIGAYSGQTWYANGKWSCIKNTIRIIPNKTDENLIPYLYYMSKHRKLWQIRGSAQPFISQTDTRNIIIYFPPEKIIKEFARITLTLLNYINKITEQNNLLSEIRDLLLPKLITGKIRVNLVDIKES